MAHTATGISCRNPIRNSNSPFCFQCTSLRRHHPNSVSFSYNPLPRSRRRSSTLRVHAFVSRDEFEDFAKRIASGEKLREFARTANDGFEELVYNTRRAARDIDRRFAVSTRFNDAMRRVSEEAKKIERDYGIERRWRTFTADFRRNSPQYRKELKALYDTPLGKFSATLFFVWFALSGWLFRLVILGTWVLPFAAPLLLGSIAKNFVIEGACPSCKRRFMGKRNQIISCTNCGAIVWQPREDFSRNKPNSTSSPDIIDIDFEEK